MKQIISCFIAFILTSNIGKAQISEHLKSNKPKYDFLLKKPVPVKDNTKAVTPFFSMYTNRQLQANKPFSIYIPVDYKDPRQTEHFLLEVGATILSNILADKMHYRYPTNPAYYNSNNYWPDR